MGCVQVGLLLLCVVVTCADHCGFGQRDCDPCKCTGRQTCRRKGIPSDCPDETKEWPCYGGTPFCHPWYTWGHWTQCDCHTTQQSRTRYRRHDQCCRGPSSETQTEDCPSIDCNKGDNGCLAHGGRCKPAGVRCADGYDPLPAGLGLCRYGDCCKCCCEVSQWTSWSHCSYGRCTPTCSLNRYGTQTCHISRSRTKCNETEIQRRTMTEHCKVPQCGCDCRPWSSWENDCDDCACQPDGTKKHKCRRHREHCDDCDGNDHESRKGSCFSPIDCGCTCRPWSSWENDCDVCACQPDGTKKHECRRQRAHCDDCDGDDQQSRTRSCFSRCDCPGEWSPWVGKCRRARRNGKKTCPGPHVEERSCGAP